MRDSRYLITVDESPGQSIITISILGPLIVGEQPDGIDYLCGGCRSAILAEAVVDGQLFDLVLQCPKCLALIASPTLVPGVAYPYGTAVELGNGRESELRCDCADSG